MGAVIGSCEVRPAAFGHFGSGISMQALNSSVRVLAREADRSRGADPLARDPYFFFRSSITCFLAGLGLGTLAAGAQLTL